MTVDRATRRTVAACAVVFAVAVVPALAGCVGQAPGTPQGFRVDVQTSYNGHRAELNGTPATGGILNVKVLDATYHRNNRRAGSAGGGSSGGGEGAFSTNTHTPGSPEPGDLLPLLPEETAHDYHIPLDEDGATHFFVQREPLILVNVQVVGKVPGDNECNELYYYWPDWIETDVESDLDLTVPWKHTCQDERGHG